MLATTFMREDPILGSFKRKLQEFKKQALLSSSLKKEEDNKTPSITIKTTRKIDSNDKIIDKTCKFNKNYIEDKIDRDEEEKEEKNIQPMKKKVKQSKGKVLIVEIEPTVLEMDDFDDIYEDNVGKSVTGNTKKDSPKTHRGNTLLNKQKETPPTTKDEKEKRNRKTRGIQTYNLIDSSSDDSSDEEYYEEEEEEGEDYERQRQEGMDKFWEKIGDESESDEEEEEDDEDYYYKQEDMDKFWKKMEDKSEFDNIEEIEEVEEIEEELKEHSKNKNAPSLADMFEDETEEEIQWISSEEEEEEEEEKEKTEKKKDGGSISPLDSNPLPTIEMDIDEELRLISENMHQDTANEEDERIKKMALEKERIAMTMEYTLDDSSFMKYEFKLLRHQEEAIGRAKEMERDCNKMGTFGGIIGDDMGSGKTVLVLAMTNWKKDQGPSLVVATNTVAGNWEKELEKHTILKTPTAKESIEGRLPRRRLKVVFITENTSNITLKDIKGADLVITTYAGLVIGYQNTFMGADDIKNCKNLNPDTIKKFREKYSNLINELDHAKRPIVQANHGEDPLLCEDKRTRCSYRGLFAVKFKRVFLDEGHKIKNAVTYWAKACMKLCCQHRWVLTGTLLQNDLTDIFSLFRFVGLRNLPTWNDFKTMRNDLSVTGNFGHNSKDINNWLDKIVIRRKQADMSKADDKMALPHLHYWTYMKKLKRNEQMIYDCSRNKLKTLNIARAKQVEEIEKQKALRKRGWYSTKEKATYSKEVEEEEEEEEEEEIEDDIMTQEEKQREKDIISDLMNRCTESGIAGIGEGSISDQITSQVIRMRQICCGASTIDKNIFSDPCFGIESTKCDMLIDLIRNRLLKKEGYYQSIINAKPECVEEAKKAIQNKVHKMLVFFSWTSNMDVVEERLKKEGISYCRIDGSTSSAKRKAIIQQFNKDNTKLVFLLSIKAANEGWECITANRVVFFNPAYNPSDELQAIKRCYRYGQTNEVHATWLLIKDTCEPMIYQITKEKLAETNVVDTRNWNTIRKSRLTSLTNDENLRKIFLERYKENIIHNDTMDLQDRLERICKALDENQDFLREDSQIEDLFNERTEVLPSSSQQQKNTDPKQSTLSFVPTSSSSSSSPSNVIIQSKDGWISTIKNGNNKKTNHHLDINKETLDQEMDTLDYQQKKKKLMVRLEEKKKEESARRKVEAKKLFLTLSQLIGDENNDCLTVKIVSMPKQEELSRCLYSFDTLWDTKSQKDVSGISRFISYSKELMMPDMCMLPGYFVKLIWKIDAFRAPRMIDIREIGLEGFLEILYSIELENKEKTVNPKTPSLAKKAYEAISSNNINDKSFSVLAKWLIQLRNDITTVLPYDGLLCRTKEGCEYMLFFKPQDFFLPIGSLLYNSRSSFLDITFFRWGHTMFDSRTIPLSNQ